MIKQAREHGFNADIVSSLIKASAPIEIKQDLLAWWEEEFFPEAQEQLLEESAEFGSKYNDAMVFLQENCNIKSKTAPKKKA